MVQFESTILIGLILGPSVSNAANPILFDCLPESNLGKINVKGMRSESANIFKHQVQIFAYFSAADQAELKQAPKEYVLVTQIVTTAADGDGWG